MVTAIVAFIILVAYLFGVDLNFWEIELYVTLVGLTMLVIRWGFYFTRYAWRGSLQPFVTTQATPICVCGHEVGPTGELSATFKHIMNTLAWYMHNDLPKAPAFLYAGDHGFGWPNAHKAKQFAIDELRLPAARVKTPTEEPIRGMWTFNTYQEIAATIRVTNGHCIFLCQEYQHFRVRIIITMLGYNCPIIVAPYPPGRKLYELVLVPYTIIDPHNFVLNLVSETLKPMLVPVWRRFRERRA